MSTPHPPAAVVAAVVALRAAFDDIHQMHECDQACPDDCDLTDYSEAAYRAHDEHNFDVREVIHEWAEGLVAALEDWLGVTTLANEEAEAYCGECGGATGEGVSPQHGQACSLHPANVH